VRPIVALLTDFGTRDHYAGAMKGVILGIAADVTLVDLTHDIPPHNVLVGALELAACYKYFPQGTIFVAVVDPGVGSVRRAIAVDTGDHRFVAPDNGVLTLVLKEAPPRKIVELTERRYARPTVSRTFEGRDRFAPAAAWLAKGIQLSALGRPLSDIHHVDVPVPEVSADSVAGVVLRVDRFGNLVTNVDRKTAERFLQGRPVVITAGAHRIERLVATYAELPAQGVGALFGSTDHLELAAPSASAAERLGVGRGTTVTIARAEP
jgi:S-adenosyl-L-methionine hydrolase (adenosine-forming)